MACLLFHALRLAPLGRSEGMQGGRWQREFQAHGVTFHQADCMIAAAAEGIGATLATANVADFPMAGVHVEYWPVGP